MIKAAFLTCVTITHVLLLASATGAQSLDAARAAYAEGRFIEAAGLAEDLKTSEGYALAAKSLAIHSYYIAEDDEKQALFDRAMPLAQEAIRLDAVNPKAHLQSAHAMGRYAQTIGVLQTISEGYVEKVRKAIENALLLDPEMAAAHLSLATWHAEAVNGSGAFMADLLYGATEADAIAHYERAIKLAPDEKVVLVEYALGLLLLDDENREQARDLFVRALEMPSKDAYDRILHQRTVERLAALDGRQSSGMRPRQLSPGMAGGNSSGSTRRSVLQ